MCKVCWGRFGVSLHMSDNKIKFVFTKQLQWTRINQLDNQLNSIFQNCTTNIKQNCLITRQMLLTVSSVANGGVNRKSRVTLTQHTLLAVKLSLVLNPRATDGETT